jgi:hypothetical protein
MKSHDWEASSKRVAVISAVVAILARCGPTVYQRAYDYCLRSRVTPIMI